MAVKYYNGREQNAYEKIRLSNLKNMLGEKRQTPTLAIGPIRRHGSFPTKTTSTDPGILGWTLLE